MGQAEGDLLQVALRHDPLLCRGERHDPVLCTGDRHDPVLCRGERHDPVLCIPLSQAIPGNPRLQRSPSNLVADGDGVGDLLQATEDTTAQVVDRLLIA